MEWISNWIQGIIVAVIIGTLIEMILPEGNCKKYIKVVIGVYIMFSIISPVITKITGNEFRVSDIFDLDEYIEASSKNTQENIQNNQQMQIKEVYINSLKRDMQEKILEKGYEIEKIDLEIENDEKYTLKKIFIYLKGKDNLEEQSNEVNNVETVNEIKISGKNYNQKNENVTNNKEKEANINSKEEKKLKQYLSSVYNLNEENININ